MRHYIEGSDRNYFYTTEPHEMGVVVRLYDAVSVGYPLVWWDVQPSEDEAVRALEEALSGTDYEEKWNEITNDEFRWEYDKPLENPLIKLDEWKEQHIGSWDINGD